MYVYGWADSHDLNTTDSQGKVRQSKAVMNKGIFQPWVQFVPTTLSIRHARTELLMLLQLRVIQCMCIVCMGIYALQWNTL